MNTEKYVALCFEEVFDNTNEIMVRVIARGNTAAECKKNVLESKTPWGLCSDDTWENLIRNLVPDLEDATADNSSYCYFDDHYGCKGYYTYDGCSLFYMETDEAAARVLVGIDKGTADLGSNYYEVVLRNVEDDFDSCTATFANTIIKLEN